MNERVGEILTKVRGAANFGREILLIPHSVPRSIRENGGLVERVVSYGMETVIIGTPLVFAATAIAEGKGPLEVAAWISAGWGFLGCWNFYSRCSRINLVKTSRL